MSKPIQLHGSNKKIYQIWSHLYIARHIKMVLNAAYLGNYLAIIEGNVYLYLYDSSKFNLLITLR